MKRNFDPKRFLDFSKELLDIKDLGDDEALCRTINGRCYFATVLYAIVRLGLEPEAKHRKLHDELIALDRKLAKDFTYLFIYRSGADYYLEMPSEISYRDEITTTVYCNRAEAEECILRAERFFTGLDSKL